MASSTPAARGRVHPATRRRAAGAGALVIGMLGTGLVAAVIALKPTVDDAIKEITLPLRHEDVIRQQSRDKNLDPALVAAVIYRESKFRDATSSRGRQGPDADPAEHRSVHRPPQRAGPSSRCATSRTRRSTSPTGAGTCATCSTATTATRWPRSPRTTPGTSGSTTGAGRSLTLDDIRFAETEDYARDVMDKRVEYRDEVPLRARALKRATRLIRARTQE